MPSTIKPDDKIAVMVWVYGGRFACGSSSRHPGGVLAVFNDVIVVTINYRLGILGFFNIPGTDVKGNYGMLDQVCYLLDLMTKTFISYQKNWESKLYTKYEDDYIEVRLVLFTGTI